MFKKQKVPYRLVREIFWVLTLNFDLTPIVIELRWVVLYQSTIIGAP